MNGLPSIHAWISGHTLGCMKARAALPQAVQPYGPTALRPYKAPVRHPGKTAGGYAIASLLRVSSSVY